MSVSFNATIFTICYVSLYSLFLLIIIISHYDPSKNLKENIRLIWHKRGIYGASIVQIFDQASDIGVLIVWWSLSILEQKSDSNNIENIDMTTLVDLSVLSLLLSRLFMMNMASLAYMYRQANGIDIVLALFDLYVIKQVYIAFKNKQDEATPAMRMAQLFEAIVESFPQILLQSIYLIRTYNNDRDDYDTTSVWLITFSILSSAASIANKFIAWDKKNHAFDSTAQSPKNIKGKGCINEYYLIRLFWRYSHIVSRLCLFSLLWTVCGGAFVLLFFLFSVIIYYFFSKKYYYSIRVNNEGCIASNATILSNEELMNNKLIHIGNNYGWGNTLVNYFFYHTIAVIWIDDLNKRTIVPSYHVLHHLIENVICYAMIIVFSLIEFECVICAEYGIRNVYDNAFVFWYLVVGISSVIISPLLFLVIKNKSLIIGNPDYFVDDNGDSGGNKNKPHNPYAMSNNEMEMA